MNRNQTVDLPKTIKIKLQENEYIVNFPNVGQVIDIEVKKSMYSARQYSYLALSNLKSSNYALDLIETIAIFTTLVPKLEEDLKVKSLFDLDLISIKELVDQYKKVFLPWYEGWKKIIQLDEEEVEQKKDSTGDSSDE